MASVMAAVADEIEPDAVELIGQGSDELVALASIAISLRRLADQLARREAA